MLKIKCKFLRSHRKQSYKKLFWLWLFDIGATNSQALSVALQPLLEGRGGVIVLQGCCEPVQPGCTGRVLFCSSERSFGTQRADFLLSLKSFTKTLQMVYIDTGYFSAKLLTQMRRPSSTSAITGSMKSMVLVVLGFSSLSCPWCPWRLWWGGKPCWETYPVPGMQPPQSLWSLWRTCRPWRGHTQSRGSLSSWFCRKSVRTKQLCLNNVIVTWSYKNLKIERTKSRAYQWK